MNWVFVILAGALFLGLRDRVAGGSTTVTLLVLVGATLGYVYVTAGK